MTRVLQLASIFAPGLLFVSAALAVGDAGGNDTDPPAPGPTPIAEWRFDGADTLGAWQGKGHHEAPGPRPPQYPTFATNNQAVEIAGEDAALVVPDPGTEGPVNLRFDKGDSITLECWVRLREIGVGQQVYLIGKGRNETKAFGAMNQNYALRLKGGAEQVSIGFLFTSRATEGHPAGWHRWWSAGGMRKDGVWHHVAVSYTFGAQDSLKGYVDGQAVSGVWDMEGATDLAPVTDGDALLIGSGFKRSKEQTLDGWLDDVAIYRTALPPEILTTRYAHTPPPPAVRREDLIPGRVLMQICENGVPEVSAWPLEPVPATETYQEDAFGFFAIPQKYISTGVRGDRSNPYLLRAAAMVQLPKGKNRVLLRSRGAAHFYLDGKEVMSNPFAPRDTSGHNHVSAQDHYLNLGPDFRFAPPGNRETWCEVESDGAPHMVVLETIVGGRIGKKNETRIRPELGETVLAFSPEGQSSWELLTPTAQHLAYTDEGWAQYRAQQVDYLDKLNDQARAACRTEHAPYWQHRHQAAQDWLAATPEVTVPPLPQNFPGLNAIDHFLGDRIATAMAVTPKTAADDARVDYFRDVQPILESKCYSCHGSAKVKGGLHLDERSAALAGGKDDGPAITPGQPAHSALLKRVQSTDADEVMPPQGKGDPLTAKEVALLQRWVQEGAVWPEFRPRTFHLTELADDLTFLRRLTLDIVGLTPSEREIRAFLADSTAERRAHAIDRLLADSRWADRWTGYWEDVLAENPNILNPTLNNTGPFRWWIYESLRDNKPMDLWVTELLRMEGSERFGGPAGFGVASQNDVPMAAKAIVVSAAFQGVDMKCARCHDSPNHSSKQEDLFNLAAMLATKPLTVPTTSSVPMDRIHQGGRKPLIEVTLKPGSTVKPEWPFARFCTEADFAALAEHPDNPRDRLAALITAPANTRFAEVIVNRIWREFMGRGIVEPVDDWEKGRPTHPALLQWLSREFVRSGYDVKALTRLIVSSHAYQRAIAPELHEPDPLYTSPARRRLNAEQVVDSLFTATGKPFHVEEVSLDIDGVRTVNDSISLGQPRRAWMLTSTSNERDRPSLALPRIQAVSDVLEIFGWRGARPDSTTARDTAPNVLQPAILSNGTMSGWLTRLSDDHGVTKLALEQQPVEQLVHRLFLRLLTREPSEVELRKYAAYLEPGYEGRLTPAAPPAVAAQPRVREHYVSWSNHLDGEATLVRHEQEIQARKGDAPTARLEADWRGRLEDVLWALLNAPEWVFTR